MASQFPRAGSKIQSHFHGIWPGRGRRPCRRKEAKPSPTAQLCREFMWGWGWCPGGILSLALRRCPSLPGGWCFKDKALPSCYLWGNWQPLTNPLQFAPTNPACSLGGQEPFFTRSCTQLCLRETALAGVPEWGYLSSMLKGRQLSALLGWAEAERVEKGNGGG